MGTKVYTHYIERPECYVRWRTLLHYGSSWEIIDSVVMMNPGSASPKCKVVDSTILAQLSNLDASEEDWHEFSEDPTMCHVGELFAKYYRKDSRHELDGIIQIFNLLYLRDAKLERALEVVKSLETYPWPTCEEDIELIINSPGPVYLGFGQLAHDELLSRRARMFYDAVKTRMSYLKESFEANKFYHPAYLMGRGRNRDCAKLALTDFCEQSCADFK